MVLKDENYINVSGWMVNRLNLKGNELLTYALIYGFSQDGENEYNGSAQYIADWLNTSKQTVFNVLKSLVSKGLITRTEKKINNITFCSYKITAIKESLPVVKNFDGGSQKSLPGVVKNFDGGSQKSLQGVVKNFDGGSQKSLPNNKDINNKDIKKDNKTIISDFVNQFTFISATKEELIEAISGFKEMRIKIKKPLTDKALNLMFNKLKDYSGLNGDIAIEILENSILNSWQGIFPPKEINKPQVVNYSNEYPY